MIKVQVNDEAPVLIEKINPGSVVISGKEVPFDIIKSDENQYHIIIDGRSYTFELGKQDSNSTKILSVGLNGKNHQIKIIEEIDELLEKMGIGNTNTGEITEVKAPMPGVILEIKTNGESRIKKGDPLIVLEAMKMENIIKSPIDGKIAAVKVKKGEKVEKNSVLVEFQKSNNEV
jgi:biotin carboxyl carrier protein